MNIGSTLKELRAKNGLSQAQLAKIVDVKVSAISRWEQNMVKPNLEMAVKLATALNVSMDVFCGLAEAKDSVLVNLAKKATKLSKDKIKALELVVKAFVN